MGCDGSKDATADRRRQPAPGGGRQQGAGQQQGRPQGTNAYPIQQQRPVQGQLVQPGYPPSQNVASRPVCQYFMQGFCRNGATCPYLHPMYISAPAQQVGPNPPVARPVCANFLAGSCPAGPGCPYAHVAPAQYGQSRQPMPNPLPYGYGASPPQSVPYRNGAPIAPIPQSQRQQPQQPQPQQPGQGQGSREDDEALQAALAASVTDHREDEDRRQLAAALAASAATAEREAVEISLIEEQRRRDQQRRSAEPPAQSVASRPRPVEPQSPAPGPPAAVDIRNQDPMRVFAVFPYAAPKDCSTETADDKSCAICFDDYAPGVLVMALPCLHRFHATCARDWIAKQPVCPACNCDVYNTGSLTLRA